MRPRPSLAELRRVPLHRLVQAWGEPGGPRRGWLYWREPGILRSIEPWPELPGAGVTIRPDVEITDELVATFVGLPLPVDPPDRGAVFVQWDAWDGAGDVTVMRKLSATSIIATGSTSLLERIRAGEA